MTLGYTIRKCAKLYRSLGIQYSRLDPKKIPSFPRGDHCKSMQLLKHRKFVILLVAAGLVVAWVYRPCYYDGCYGPFEIVIKAEKGERVEDLVIRLSHITAGSFEGSTHTYKETVVGNTDETIRFPRGYVYDSDNEELTLHYSLLHPDYSSRDLFAKFPNSQGVIDLGEKIAFSKQDLHDRSIAKKIGRYRDEGYSEEEVEEKLKGERLYNPVTRFVPDYYGRLLSMGRQDIVDKYLPRQLNDYYEHKNFSAAEAAKFKAKLMASIERYRK